MKIATFNINDVNKRLRNLIGWLRAEKHDVIAEAIVTLAVLPSASLRQSAEIR